jgi:hypothetical protein
MALKRIDAIAGPHAGERISMPLAAAKLAIADGWAIEPDAEYPDLTQEQYELALIAAEKAARKLRGEAEPPSDGPPIPPST